MFPYQLLIKKTKQTKKKQVSRGKEMGMMANPKQTAPWMAFDIGFLENVIMYYRNRVWLV